MNYRSAVVFGRGEVVNGEEKISLLDAFTEQLIPGTANDYRAMLPKEIKATELIRIPLDEASAKIRDTDPVDDEEDLELDHWAGIIPLTTIVGKPVAAANLPASLTPKDELVEAMKNYPQQQ
jgi:hypothetical protein